MLTLTMQDEFWDEEAERFVYVDRQTLSFEHSLISLSKWEAKYHKLFLTKDEKTEEEMLGYIEAMLVTPVDDLSILQQLNEDQVKALDAYINDPMTGTTISELPNRGPRVSERLSSELIYYWMSMFQIPIECQHWHLNRLFTLIKVHHAKSQKPQRQPAAKTVRTMAEINAARRAQLGTSG